MKIEYPSPCRPSGPDAAAPGRGRPSIRLAASLASVAMALSFPSLAWAGADQTLPSTTPTTPSSAPSTAPPAAPPTAPSATLSATQSVNNSKPIAIDLELYGPLLEKHTQSVTDVVGTRVDYAALNRSADWKRLVQTVHTARPSTLTRNEQLAYWINAYNILAIDLIAKHYPINSIRDLGSFFSPVWDKTVATIEDRKVSLGFIEHEILRKMSEPRIHAAIVCASTSCPPLARTPFRATSLDSNLDDAMRAWLVSPEKGVRIDRKRNRIGLSKIFDWFEEDFATLGGPLVIAAQYLPEEDAEWLRTAGKRASIDFLDYDWSLNDL